MTRRRSLCAALGALAATIIVATGLGASAALAVPGGEIGVLAKGAYVCELPGDIGDPGIAAGRHVPEADFEVIGDSSYRVGKARGVYLRTGDEVVMSTGPQQGRKFHLESEKFLRVVDPDGTDGAMRCVRSAQAVGLDPAEPPKCPEAPADPSRTALADIEAAPACKA